MVKVTGKTTSRLVNYEAFMQKAKNILEEGG